jgi:hypothetical protein
MKELLEIKYVGVVALLGRLCRNLEEEDMDLVKMAMEDLMAEFPDRFEIWKTNGGYSLEPKRSKPLTAQKEGV